MNFISATKIWNDNKKEGCKTSYCVPRKSTKEYYDVIAIMDKDKLKPSDKTDATNKIKAVIKRNQTKKIEKIEKIEKTTNIMDLPDNVLDIIGENVKKNNKRKYVKKKKISTGNLLNEFIKIVETLFNENDDIVKAFNINIKVMKDWDDDDTVIVKIIKQIEDKTKKYNFTIRKLFIKNINDNDINTISDLKQYKKVITSDFNWILRNHSIFNTHMINTDYLPKYKKSKPYELNKKLLEELLNRWLYIYNDIVNSNNVGKINKNLKSLI